MTEIEKLAEQLAGQPPLEIEFEYSSDYWTALGKWKHDRLMAWKGASAVIERIRERMPPANTVGELRYMATVNEILDNIK